MNAKIVYQVAKALPIEEQFLLFEKLKNDFITAKKSNKNKKVLLTRASSINYLLTNVFSKKVKKIN